jgi:hypothetical protein
MLKIRGQFAVNRDGLSRARMDEFKMLRVKRNPSDKLLRRFGRVVFSIADERMTNGRKLSSDLILQPCHEFNSN